MSKRPRKDDSKGDPKVVPPPLPIAGNGAVPPVVPPGQPEEPEQTKRRRQDDGSKRMPMEEEEVSPPHAYGADASGRRHHKGTSCHQCKSTKPMDRLKFCSNTFNKRTKPGKRRCRKKYCDTCLQKFYRDDPEDLLKSWICPSCRNCCSCAACVRSGTRRDEDGELEGDGLASRLSTTMASAFYPGIAGLTPQMAQLMQQGLNPFGFDWAAAAGAARAGAGSAAAGSTGSSSATPATPMPASSVSAIGQAAAHLQMAVLWQQMQQAQMAAAALAQASQSSAQTPEQQKALMQAIQAIQTMQIPGAMPLAAMQAAAAAAGQGGAGPEGPKDGSAGGPGPEGGAPEAGGEGGVKPEGEGLKGDEAKGDEGLKSEENKAGGPPAGSPAQAWASNFQDAVKKAAAALASVNPQGGAGGAPGAGGEQNPLALQQQAGLAYMQQLSMFQEQAARMMAQAAKNSATTATAVGGNAAGTEGKAGSAATPALPYEPGALMSPYLFPGAALGAFGQYGGFPGGKAGGALARPVSATALTPTMASPVPAAAAITPSYMQQLAQFQAHHMRGAAGGVPQGAQAAGAAGTAGPMASALSHYPQMQGMPAQNVSLPSLVTATAPGAMAGAPPGQSVHQAAAAAVAAASAAAAAAAAANSSAPQAPSALSLPLPKLPSFGSGATSPAGNNGSA